MTDKTDASNGGGGKPGEEREIFGIEPLPEPERKPDPPKPKAVPATTSAPPAASSVKPGPSEATKHGLMGRLGGMLEGFDEDADFETDPEVDAAMGKRPPATPGTTAPEPPPRPVLVKEGPRSPGVLVGVACVLLLGAVIGAAVNEKDHPAVASVLTVYDAGLHACTGVAALAGVAVLLRRSLGRIDLAASRMFVAVSAFLLLYNLKIDLIGTSKWEELTLGAAAYVGVVAVLFRLWKRPLMYVVCAHFFLWMTVQIGMQLSAWMATKP